jgi:uncharacterized protein
VAAEAADFTIMARSPFIADIVALRRHQGHREHLSVHAPLAGLRVTGSEVPSREPVDLDLVLEAVEGGIVVVGEARARWAGECRRCLGPVHGELTAHVEELFVRDSEDGETYPIGGDHIDLEPLAREAFVLALPLAPVCRTDCAGLCPVCGADLNCGPCACPPADTDPRWAALDALRPEP